MPRPPARFKITASNIDTALRYDAIIRLLRDRWKPDLRILEVGSGAGGITEFLAHPVVGVDPAFGRTSERATGWLTPVHGSADSLPFRDASFDAVVCAEVLEHLDATARDRSLMEMTRVLRPGGTLIATFPSGAAARRCDIALNNAHLAKYGKAHPWVSEHIEHGVPEGTHIAAQLRELLNRRGTVTLRSQAWAPAWRFQQLALVVGHYRPFTLPLYLQPGARALFGVLRHLNFAPCYRAIVIADLY